MNKQRAIESLGQAHEQSQPLTNPHVSLSAELRRLRVTRSRRGRGACLPDGPGSNRRSLVDAQCHLAVTVEVQEAVFSHFVSGTQAGSHRPAAPVLRTAR